jgi:endo-1,4-beta-mannosidase
MVLYVKSKAVHRFLNKESAVHRRLLKIITAALIVVATLVSILVLPGVGQAQLLGANTHSWKAQTSDAEGLSELDAIAALPGNVVRFDVEWGQIESSKGVYAQAPLDKLGRLLAAAAQRHLKVIITLLHTPCWASSAPADLKGTCDADYWRRGVAAYAPTKVSDYADFAGMLVQRYGSQIYALEVWNEPNATAFWRTSDGKDPDKVYVRLLKSAYTAVKAANSNVRVLTGGTSRADGAWVKHLYSDGMKGYSDGVAIHPYSAYPTQHTSDPTLSFVDGVPWIHKIMAANGEASNGVWITEVGYSTCSSTTACVSEAVQADYTRQLASLASQWSYVSALIFYDLRNDGVNSAAKEENFGLMTRDFVPKPAYYALQKASAKSRKARKKSST